jgi:hypothetical protein
MSKPAQFKPTPAPITFSMREMLGRLHLPLLPSAGLNWREYIKSGGPARYIGKVSCG